MITTVVLNFIVLVGGLSEHSRCRPDHATDLSPDGSNLRLVLERTI
jgi:hypothetical protein